jgi:hypothetical protein
MANTLSYPKAAAKKDDLILGTSMPLPNTNEDPRTVNFSIAQVNGLANSPDIATTAITITDAQLRSIGTVPVEILPVVSGYIYQILGATAQPINAGGIGDDYGWGGQSGVISSRTNNFTTLHRVEIPDGELPSGGIGVSDSLYVATPIAGNSRASSKIYVTVTGGIDPVVTPGENPSATWRITLTYRLIQL